MTTNVPAAVSDTGDASARAEEEFCTNVPAYAETRTLDDLRQRDYARLDATGTVYLDYTGGGLYAESQLRDHLSLLSTQVFGNPQPTTFRQLYEIGVEYGKTTSALRISLGIASNFADVWRFIE